MIGAHGKAIRQPAPRTAQSGPLARLVVGRPAGKARGLEMHRAVPQEVLGKGIDMARGGYMDYRILTDQVLSPFGYNLTPTRIEFNWIEVQHRKYE